MFTPMKNPNLPEVLPTPKEIISAEGGALRSQAGSTPGVAPVFRLLFPDDVAEIVRCAPVIAEELRDMSGATIVEDENAVADFTVSLTIEELPHSSSEAYRLVVGDSIEMCANAAPGLLYATATLRQLLQRNAAGEAGFYRCEIFDYPDIEYRCAACWLVDLESRRMMYDWGDGREKMLERYRRKIDFCLRHKINVAFFDGCMWQLDKYPQYAADVRVLNAYARARNVRLEFGGHGIGYAGFPGHPLQGAKGLGGYNRRSYPNGEIYDCGKIPGAAFDQQRASVTSDAMRNGTCRSNEALNRLKQKELAEYVAALEPGVLYIHHEDIFTYDEFEQMWLNRCASCRERWPDDAIASSNGAAAAIAHGFRWLYDGVASVKNPASGYDGARDCTIIFASPNYGTCYEDDAGWEKICAYWVAISRELGAARQPLFCMREQFFNFDDNRLRLRELAERMRREGGGHGLFVLNVSGADLYANSAHFVATPRLNHFFEGARALFNFNGGLFSAPQEIYNAEYSWNLHSPFGIDEADDYESALSLYKNRYEKAEYSRPDALLQRACEICYGAAAPDMMRFYELRDDDNNFPAAMLFLLFRNLFNESYADHDRARQEKQWTGIQEQTVQAIAVVEAALRHTFPRPEARKEVEYLRACLIFGDKISALVADVFGESPDWKALEARIQELQKFVATNYPHDFTSPDEGDMSLWPKHLEQLLEFIRQPQLAK